LHGQETVSVFIANLLAIFNNILCKIFTIFYAETMELSFIADVVWHYDSERHSHSCQYSKMYRKCTVGTF